MYQPNYLCDLHMHTVRSDGNDTYTELIDTAAGLGMKVIAITDHDVAPLKTIDVDGKAVGTVDYARGKGLEVLPGIEYSCDSQIDDVHIVGLGCDWSDPLFGQMNRRIEQSKIKGYKKLTEVLCAHGINVTWEEVLYNDGDARRPEDIQRKHIFERIAKNGHAKNWQEAKLMVKNNPVYNIKREKPDPLYIIDLIHWTGGIAILAHPYLIDEDAVYKGAAATRSEYIENLIDAGLDGIEAAYTYSKTSYGGTLPEEAIEAEIRARYGKRLPIISGGSDYHNDGRKGVRNPRMIGEKGVTLEYFRHNRLLSGLTDGSSR